MGRSKGRRAAPRALGGREPRKKALLIGINQFKSVSGLKGCLNDISNMRAMLLDLYGFGVLDVRLLADNRAVWANIKPRMDWLLAGAREGDQLVLHISSHGSQIRDRDGDELSDFLDELVCLHDMTWDEPKSYILDDDFYRWTRNLPQRARLTVILDTCHSGTGTRGLAWGMGAPGEPDGSRYVAPPVDVAARVEPGMKVRHLCRGRALNHVLLAACRSDQYASDAEINGSYNGAFTYYLCKAVRDASGKLTYAQATEKTREYLRAAGYEQIPETDGPGTDRQLFA